MLQRFNDYVRQQHLFPSGQEVLLAVSGGRDSVALAHLASLSGIPFAIAHCNFHLRLGECDRDQQFVSALATSYGVRFHTVDFDTRAYAAAHGQSLEEAARQLRYGWFADLCRQHGYACLATAHHRDDSVETFFLNLLRGTGIAGLHGIRPISLLRINNSELKIVRPMLSFSRTEIDRYIEENQLPYVEDSTNAELDARRNQIRLRLMPLLRELYPSVDDTMAANIERLHDTELLYRAYLDELRPRFMKPFIPQLPYLSFEIQSLDLSALTALHSPLSTILFELLHPYGFNASTVEDIFNHSGSSSSKQSSGCLFHSPTHTAELRRGTLLLAPKVDPVPPTIAFHHSPFTSHLTPHTSRLSALFDASLVRQPLSLRPWQRGDRFYPFGMKQSRLVSDFLKDSHLSRIERNHLYVLVDADDRILWVVGLRADDRFRLTASTTGVLTVTLV